MPTRIKPLAYDEDGYSHTCKACMARRIAEGATDDLARALTHVFRDAGAAIRGSGQPLAVKVRKQAGLNLRREKVDAAVNTLLGAFYDMWADLEDIADHERAAVRDFTEARKKGALAKLARDPAQAAKQVAIDLWPEASRKGWTAERMWTALRDGGHQVPADTVRKWMTKLRKNGTC